MALPRVPIYGRRTLNIVDGSSTWSTLVQFVFEDGNEGSEAIEVACAEIKTPSVVMAFTASMRGAFYGVAVRSLRHGERSRRFRCCCFHEGKRRVRNLSCQIRVYLTRLVFLLL